MERSVNELNSEDSAGAGLHFSLHLFLCLRRPSLFPSRDVFQQNLKWRDFWFFQLCWEISQGKKMMSVCVFTQTSLCILWPFVDSWCRVNAIMTSRDAICFPGSRVIQPLWGVKRSTEKQHQQLLERLIFTGSHTDIIMDFTLKQYDLRRLWMSVSFFTPPFWTVHHSYCYWLLKSHFP